MRVIDSSHAFTVGSETLLRSRGIRESMPPAAVIDCSRRLSPALVLPNRRLKRLKPATTKALDGANANRGLSPELDRRRGHGHAGVPRLAPTSSGRGNDCRL